LEPTVNVVEDILYTWLIIDSSTLHGAKSEFL